MSNLITRKFVSTARVEELSSDILSNYFRPYISAVHISAIKLCIYTLCFDY